MAAHDTLSETFLPDITNLVKRFRKFLNAEEFRNLKAAIKIGDLSASAYGELIRATLRLADEVRAAPLSIPASNAFWGFMELRDEWMARIHDEGDILTISMCLYRLHRDGKWNGVQVRYR